MLRLLTLFILFFAAAFLRADETFQIKLHRPVKAGDRLAMEGKVTWESDNVWKYDGVVMPGGKSTYEIRYSCDARVVATSANGWATGIEVVFKDVALVKDGSPLEGLKPGDTAEIKSTVPYAAVTVNGKPVGPGMADMIGTAFSLSPADLPTADEVMGMPASVKVGDTWKVNPKWMIDSWRRIGMGELTPEECKGECKIDGIEEFEGQKAMRLIQKTTTDGSRLNPPILPKTMRVTRYIEDAELRTLVPLNPAKLGGLNVVTTKVKMSAEGELERNGTKVQATLESVMKRVIEQKSAESR